MEAIQKIGFDLSQIAEVFNIVRDGTCTHLKEWLNASYTLSEEENHIIDRVYEQIADSGDYWNEEELKIKAVGLLFFLADVSVKNRIEVFYERPLAAVVNGYQLSVITDCMIATQTAFNIPKHPYFFLQEFKKGKGEKRDPEAQMLTAMLIAQELNKDDKVVYGGYLVGSNWRFTTLIGNAYCISQQYNAADKNDLLQIIFILRKLKELILAR